MIPASLWTPGSPFRNLTAGAQRLYLYLITSPDRAVTGVQPLRPGKWAAMAKDTTRADTEASLAELVATGSVIADYDTDEVMVRWYMRDTGVTANAKWMKTVPAAVELVESVVIRQAIASELGMSGDMAAAGTKDSNQESLFSEDPQVNTPSDGVSDAPSQKNGDRSLSYLLSPISNLQSLTSTTENKPRARASDLTRFAEFYAAYPRHVGRAAAEKSWASALERGVPPDTVIAAASRYAADPNRLAEFTKHPATWLNQGCWDDDPLPERGNGARPDAGERFVWDDP